MSRIKTAFLSGTITDNPLTNVATTINSAALANLPAIASPDIAVLVLDPAGSAGAPEVVWVTAHTGSATSATIARAKEGTSAREHASTIPWVHGPTIIDVEEDLTAGIERQIFAEDVYRQIGVFTGAHGASITPASTELQVPVGWHYVGTNSSFFAPTSSDSIWRLGTGTASGDYSAIYSITRFVVSEDATLIVRSSVISQATQNVFFGFSTAANPTDANSRIGFRILDTGNIIGFVDNAGTETTRDSSATPTGSMQNFKVQVSDGGTIVRFFVDGVQVGANVTTNIPTGVLYPIVGVNNTTTVQRIIGLAGCAYWCES